MLMRTSGVWRNSTNPTCASFTSVRLRSLYHHSRSWLPEAAPHRKRMPGSTCLLRMKSLPSNRWASREMPTRLLFVKVTCLSWEALAASNVWTQWRSTSWQRTNGSKLPLWKTNVTTCQRAQSTMSSFMRLAAFSEVLSKKSTTPLKFSKLRKTTGLFTK